MSETKKWYLCDPKKNVECKKRICLIDCLITSKKECAVRNESGEPIEVNPRKMLMEKMHRKKLFQ